MLNRFKKTANLKMQLKALFLLLVMGISSYILFFSSTFSNITFIDNEENTETDESLKTSAPSSILTWWNETWTYRVRIEIKAQDKTVKNVPIEKRINFTQLLHELNDYDRFDWNSTRVVEYVSSTQEWIEIPCTVSEYIGVTVDLDYNNKTNALVDIFWTMNGTTPKNTNRTYFIYFDSLVNSPPLKPERDYGFSPSSPPYTPGNTQNLKYGEFFRIADISAYTGRRVGQTHYGNADNPFDDVYGYPYIEELSDYEGKVGRVRDRSGRQAHAGSDQRWYMNFYWAQGTQDDFPILKVAARIDNSNTRTGLYVLTEDGWRVVMYTPNAEWTQGGYSVDHTWGCTLVPDGQWRIYEYDLRHLTNTYYATQIEWYQNTGAPNQYDFWFDNMVAYKESGALLEANRSYSIPESYVYTPEVKRANIVVRALDVHGNLIPNANITMYNQSDIIRTDFTNINGTVTFTNISHADYNFTVRFTSDIGDHERIVNSTSTAITIEKVYQEVNLTCEMSRNTFKIIDADGRPLESGWVIVGNSTGDTQIQNCTIDSSGEAIFRWLNVTPYQYNYTIKYQDNNYNPSIIWLAKGDITTRNSEISVVVNMTTVNFTLYDDSLSEIIPGAKLNISTQNNPYNVVNLTTDENGIATLRWLNSSSVGIQGNYTVRIDFYGPKTFNTETTPLDKSEFSFNVTSEDAYIFYVLLDVTDYQTKLSSLNPNDNIAVLWGTELKIRALLNVTKAGDPPQSSYLGPTYADIMEYEIYNGVLLVNSGTMPMDLDYEGRHYGIIDTKELETDVNYLISISASKSGYMIPSNLYLTLIILKHELELNQSQNDDSAKSDYWGHSVDMSVKPYGKYTESFSIQADVFKDDNHNFEFSIPDVDNDWNLSKIVFNISSIAFNVPADDIEINITDPFSDVHIWDRYNASFHYVNIYEPTGMMYDLSIDLNRKSPTNDDKYNFQIDGTFTGNVNVLAEAYFIRDVINVQYSRFNVSESISIFSDDKGWAIQNITFELKNCYDPSTWTEIDPKNTANLNITTNEGITYFLDSGTVGAGKLTISDKMIHPLDNQFLFIVDNKTNIVFDATIKVEYVQEFYKSQYFETFNLSQTEVGFAKGGTFQFELVGGDWLDNGVLLKITELKNSTSALVYPTDVQLRLAVDGYNLAIVNEQTKGYGSLSLDFLNKDTEYSSYLTSDQSITCTVSLEVTYTKTYSYETTGSVSYLIREAPDEYGNVPYDENLKYYQQTIDTSVLNVGTYTIRFTVSKDYYSSAVKDLTLVVLSRLTLINGSSDFTRFVTQSYAMEEKIFKLSFTDYLTSAPLTDLDIQSYLWERYDEQGQINATGSGTLNYDSGYYILDPNTEHLKLGEYLIVVTFSKANYDLKNAMISLTIVDRPTLINGLSQPDTIQATRYAGFDYNFTFSYVDVLSNNTITDLSEKSYTWEQYDNESQVIDSGIGVLRFNNNTQLYDLDFDSETRDSGNYELSIILNKENYTIQTSLILLNIIKRPINYDLDITNLVDDVIRVVQGDPIVFLIELTDPANNDNPLTGASVTISIGSVEYQNIEEIEDGVYQLRVSTKDKDAFITSLTLTGEITIEKDFYESVTKHITIRIGMTEIFPGFPLFYFLMILISVIAVVGSLAAYRIIQQRRIPTFIKRSRSMKKSIKGNKEVSDSLLYPSKEEYIVKKLGDKWRSIGLSLEDIMGIKEKKEMKLPEAKEEIKGGAE